MNNLDEALLYYLKNTDFNPSYNNNSLVVGAYKKGHYELVKILMNDTRVDPSDQENASLLAAAAKKGDVYVNIVKLLLSDPRIYPSDRKNDIIIEALKIGNRGVIILLPLRDYLHLLPFY
jgi:hypothetical protein